MFEKIKTWYKNLEPKQRENVDVVIGLLLVAVVFAVAVAFGYLDRKETTLPEKPAETSECINSEKQDAAFDAPYCCVDTVFAVAVHSGQTFKNSSSYKEIIFSHDLYLYCSETSGSVRHYDYNDPFYVESGDLCVVWVEFGNGEKIVTLKENLTKMELASIEPYWESALIDFD